jgi:hypothetical protein
MFIKKKSRLSRSLMKITLVEEEIEGCLEKEEEEEVVTDNLSTRPLSNVLSVIN